MQLHKLTPGPLHRLFLPWRTQFTKLVPVLPFRCQIKCHMPREALLNTPCNSNEYVSFSQIHVNFLHKTYDNFQLFLFVYTLSDIPLEYQVFTVSPVPSQSQLRGDTQQKNEGEKQRTQFLYEEQIHFFFYTQMFYAQETNCCELTALFVKSLITKLSWPLPLQILLKDYTLPLSYFLTQSLLKFVRC